METPPQNSPMAICRPAPGFGVTVAVTPTLCPDTTGEPQAGVPEQDTETVP